MPVSTPRTRAAKRELIAAKAASPTYHVKWGRVMVHLLALGSAVTLFLIFLWMAGEFMDRL